MRRPIGRKSKTPDQHRDHCALLSAAQFTNACCLLLNTCSGFVLRLLLPTKNIFTLILLREILVVLPAREIEKSCTVEPHFFGISISCPAHTNALRHDRDNQNYHREGDQGARRVRSLVVRWDGTCRFEPTTVLGCSESSDRIGLRSRQLARRLATESIDLHLTGKARDRRRAHSRRDEDRGRTLEAVFPVGGVVEHSSSRWGGYHYRNGRPPRQ